MYRTARYLSCLSVIVLLCACKTPRPENPAPCVPQTQLERLLRWGTEHDSASTVEQYTMNSKGEIFYYHGPQDKRSDGEFLVAIDQTDYCSLSKHVTDAFLKTQALNVRGKRGRFIDFRNPRTDVYLRAVWNPDLNTFQSRDVREVYDELMKQIPR